MIHDDMIIAGADEKEHDEILSKVMKRAQEKKTLSSNWTKYRW